MNEGVRFTPETASKAALARKSHAGCPHGRYPKSHQPDIDGPPCNCSGCLRRKRAALEKLDAELKNVEQARERVAARLARVHAPVRRRKSASPIATSKRRPISDKYDYGFDF